MRIKRLILTILICAGTAGCGNDDDTASGTASGTNSPSEQSLAWSSVSYNWVSAWEPCADNKLTINRNKEISSDRCGEIKTATVSDEDFAQLRIDVAPVRQNYSATLTCLNEAIMDWAVYTYITVGGETKKIYSFDQEQKCARGDLDAAEQLQERLDALHDKYVPTDVSSIGD